MQISTKNRDKNEKFEKEQQKRHVLRQRAMEKELILLKHHKKRLFCQKARPKCEFRLSATERKLEFRQKAAEKREFYPKTAAKRTNLDIGSRKTNIPPKSYREKNRNSSNHCKKMRTQSMRSEKTRISTKRSSKMHYQLFLKRVTRKNSTDLLREKRREKLSVQTSMQNVSRSSKTEMVQLEKQ